MQIPWPDGPVPPPEVRAKPALPGSQGQQAGQDDGGGNRRAFEIGHSVLTLGEALGRDVVPGKPADAAADEVRERNPVPPAPQAGRKTERGRRHAE